MRTWLAYPLLALFALSLPLETGAERALRYKMYRNPAKAQLAILPVQGGHLEPAAQETFYQILRKEAAKIRSVKIVDLPVDYRVQLYTQDSLLPSVEMLAERNVDLLLVSRLDFSDDQYSFYAEIISTKEGIAKASFQESCRCPIGELIFWILPESMSRLEDNLSARHRKCGNDMARITPGKSELLSKPGEEGGRSPVKPFCIDHFEYPNLYGEQPVLEKNYREASALCSSRGKRLCREEEWEVACQSAESRLYPYGNDYSPGACNTQSRTILTSGEMATCRSSQGVYDMSGNVFEWTASTWGPGYPDRVLRGGNWESGSENSSCRTRFAHSPDSSSQAIGFRCCSSLD